MDNSLYFKFKNFHDFDVFLIFTGTYKTGRLLLKIYLRVILRDHC